MLEREKIRDHLIYEKIYKVFNVQWSLKSTVHKTEITRTIFQQKGHPLTHTFLV